MSIEGPLGTRNGMKLPLTLGAVMLIIFAATFFTSPEGKLNWRDTSRSAFSPC